MCAVSTVIQQQFDDWWVVPPLSPPYVQPTLPTPPTPEQLEAFRLKLEEAHRKDIEEDAPECESEDKITKLLGLAEELGVRDEVKRVLQEALETK